MLANHKYLIWVSAFEISGPPTSLQRLSSDAPRPLLAFASPDLVSGSGDFISYQAAHREQSSPLVHQLPPLRTTPVLALIWNRSGQTTPVLGYPAPRTLPVFC